MTSATPQGPSWRRSLKTWWHRRKPLAAENPTPFPRTESGPSSDGALWSNSIGAELVGTDLPLGIPMPAPDADRITHYARHYFNYAEDLALRGAPDLAAPFYRQAYALLLATSQSGGSQSDSGPVPTVMTRAEPRSVPLPKAQAPGQEQLRAWREQLSPQTATTISQQLGDLVIKGIRSPELHNLQGLSALHLQDPKASEQFFRSGLALDPHHYSCLVNLAALELKNCRSQEAIVLLQRALSSSSPDQPEAVPALNNLALAHQQQGQMMEAALLVHRIHHLKPGFVRSSRLELAARTLEEMGEDKLAIDLLSWVQKNQPNPSAVRQLALLLERRGDFKTAASLYRSTMEHDLANNSTNIRPSSASDEFQNYPTDPSTEADKPQLDPKS